MNELEEWVARALIDSDPTMSGYHETHIAEKLPDARAAIQACGVAALRARIMDLERALTPFAKAYETLPSPEEWKEDCRLTGVVVSFPAEDEDNLDAWEHGLVVGDLHRARIGLGYSPRK